MKSLFVEIQSCIKLYAILCLQRQQQTDTVLHIIMNKNLNHPYWDIPVQLIMQFCGQAAVWYAECRVASGRVHHIHLHRLRQSIGGMARLNRWISGTSSKLIAAKVTSAGSVQLIAAFDCSRLLIYTKNMKK